MTDVSLNTGLCIDSKRLNPILDSETENHCSITKCITEKYIFTRNLMYIILIILFIGLLSFIEYIAFLTNEPVPFIDKIIYLLLDFFHISIVGLSYLMIYFVFTKKSKINYLLVLNIKFLIVLLLFFFYKKCILTIISSKIIKKDITFSSIYERLQYLTNNNFNYDPTSSDESSLYAWIDGNKFIVFVLIMTNIYVLYDLNK